MKFSKHSLFFYFSTLVQKNKDPGKLIPLGLCSLPSEKTQFSLSLEVLEVAAVKAGLTAAIG